MKCWYYTTTGLQDGMFVAVFCNNRKRSFSSRCGGLLTFNRCASTTFFPYYQNDIVTMDTVQMNNFKFTIWLHFSTLEYQMWLFLRARCFTVVKTTGAIDAAHPHDLEAIQRQIRMVSNRKLSVHQQQLSSKYI